MEDDLEMSAETTAMLRALVGSRERLEFLGSGASMPDEPPEQETAEEGVRVWWEPVRFSVDDIEAELPDGTRVRPVLQFGGRRLGFERPLPKGTQLYLRGKAAWRPIGESG